MRDDEHSKRVVLIAHCILNQNSRATGLAKNPSAMKPLVNFLLRNKIGIMQMPCPELAFKGVLRHPQTREQYDSPKFRKHCQRIANELVDQIQEYSKGGIELKLVLGVQGSPSCAVDVPSAGIFMDELRSALNSKRFSAQSYEICSERLREDIAQLKKLIK